MAKGTVNHQRVIGKRDPMIYGHFLEHFHRQIYGGIYEPDSPFADEQGMRKDVMEALKRISPAVVRWPGGCYVSAYHWKDGVGPERQPAYDKAWRVEESNRFGTDEFMDFCDKIEAEPYICTNAGTGTPEEMSDWVEYCNLPDQGKWARARISNGHPQPYGVKYWSIGNENYLGGEMGSKTLAEWCPFVRESAKMMHRVDPTIQLLAASTDDLDWNIHLLREAGPYLNWISIHDYWDPCWQENNISSYEDCMAMSLHAGDKIEKIRHILGSLGYLGKIRVAFDEWNLHGWHHPNVDSATEPFLEPRDKNDLNESYTMADAVFTGVFLNECLRNSDMVGMANFAPTVNTRGMIYTHKNGLVLRPTYFVFELYSRFMGDHVLDTWVTENETFESSWKGQKIQVPALDVLAVEDTSTDSIRISVINRHPTHGQTLALAGANPDGCSRAALYTVNGQWKDSFNDVEHPQDVGIAEQTIELFGTDVEVTVAPHSVNVLVLQQK